jgi:hypothetical protein
MNFMYLLRRFVYHVNRSRESVQFSKLILRNKGQIFEVTTRVLTFVIFQEKAALKKLENVKKDHLKRLEELETEQATDVHKAQLIEINLTLVRCFPI